MTSDGDVVRLAVRGLPRPPGKNRQHQIVRPYMRGGARGKARVANTPDANAWRDTAILAIRAERVRRQHAMPDPNALYWVSVICHLAGYGQDVDAPLALALDAIQDALGINDASNGIAVPVRTLVFSPQQVSVSLYIAYQVVTDGLEWNARSWAILPDILDMLGWSADSVNARMSASGKGVVS